MLDVPGEDGGLLVSSSNGGFLVTVFTGNERYDLIGSGAAGEEHLVIGGQVAPFPRTLIVPFERVLAEVLIFVGAGRADVRTGLW